MAGNEHKNLSDINRHNPLGFETAINDTVLSKSIGTASTDTDGSLVWQKKSLLGATNYKMQGYVSGEATTNYFYGVAITGNKSPFEMSIDFGGATVSAGGIAPSKVFRIGQSFIVPETATVSNINGWATSDASTDITIAICKVTPTADLVTDLVPVVIDEITVTGLGNKSKLIKIKETTITAGAVTEGDIIFAMIREATAGSDVYMNLTIQTTVF
tara:strand:+ start:572 stop:1216 length:645 start_codon:yes stop_codon:yes gene_type:complete